MQFQDTAFKDSNPADTVTRIKSILASNGIKTKEFWQPSNIPYCHAMSVCMEGTTLRSNGKGVTRELAQASGYGELIERLQMGITGSAESQKAALQDDISPLKRLPAKELWQRNHRWYEALSQKLTICTGHSMNAKDILLRFADKDGTIAVREYLCPGSGRVEYFPAEIIQRIYCTNGCAAGNTMEEAMVQAISEIVERHHQLRIFHEDLVPPEIPEADLIPCEAAWAIISYLREHGFAVSVRDCSFGTPFPVLCVCLRDVKTGRYHTHFGAFPVFEIALERALTEAFQGRTLENVAQFQNYSDKKPGVHHPCGLGNEVFFGSWEKTENFFTGQPSYPYHTTQGFHAKSNKALLSMCLKYFHDLGYDVLVQNRSALGFPTCQIIIPGISEVMVHRLHPGLDDTRYANAAAKCLRSPSNASVSDAMALMMHLQQLDQFGPKVRDAKGFSVCARLPLKLDRIQNEFLLVATLCHINYRMGRLNEVQQGIGKLIRLSSGDERDYLLKLGQNLQPYNPQRNPFDDYVLNCDFNHCTDCRFAPVCCYQSNHALSTLISAKTAQLDANDFSNFLKDV